MSLSLAFGSHSRIPFCISKRESCTPTCLALPPSLPLLHLEEMGWSYRGRPRIKAYPFWNSMGATMPYRLSQWVAAAGVVVRAVLETDLVIVVEAG